MKLLPAYPFRLKDAPVSVFLFVVVLALRLYGLAKLTESQFLLPNAGDMQFYNDWALRILRGNWTDHMAFYGLPLYAYLLAAVYWVCGPNPFVPGFLQACLEAGTAVLLYQLGVLVFAAPANEKSPPSLARQGKFIGLLAALGWACFQPALGYSIILMPTAWLVFVFWFVVWQIVKRPQAPALSTLLLLGGLMGFTAMGIATILFLVPLLLAALFLRWSGSSARRVVGVGMIMAGVFLGASPAWIHNYFIARDPVFLSAHSGVNFWIGNNPVATGYPKFPPGLHAGQEAMLKDSITSAEKALGRPLKRSEVSAYWSEKARAWIRAHPRDFVRLLGTKLRNFWSAFSYDDISVITALRDQSIILPGARFRPRRGTRPARSARRLLENSQLTLDRGGRAPAHGITPDGLRNRTLSPGRCAGSPPFRRLRALRALAEHCDRALPVGGIFPAFAFLQHRICLDATKGSDALGAGYLQFRVASPRRTSS